MTTTTTSKQSSGMVIEGAAERGISASRLEIEVGRSHPLGATPDTNGVNFSVFADRATSVELLLFEGYKDTSPCVTI